jgi:serine/threonine-protein kinase
MATVHLGRMHGAVGFARVVAIKRLHSHYAHDAHFVEMFLDEARLAARLKHPNVITTLDVVADDSEVFLVMEFVLGASLEGLIPREGERAVPLSIVASILCNMLEGLHGAHEALSDTGEPLGIVHRDVSPSNVIVGEDGVSRVFDFGIAKANINTQETRDGVIKGKVTYMAPEQLTGGVDRRADIYAAGVILWELVVGRRRHAGERNDALFVKLATNALEPLAPVSHLRIDAPEELDAIIARATAVDPERRFGTAREMAMAIESVIRPAMAREVAEWVRDVAGARIERLADLMKRIEGDGPPRSEPSLPIMPRPSTGSVRLVMGTLTRAGGVASSVPPFDASDAEVVGSGGPPYPAARRRSWTMPAALLAFTAAMLLVGLRTLAGRAANVAGDRSALSAAAAPPLDVVAVSQPESTLSMHARVPYVVPDARVVAPPRSATARAPSVADAAALPVTAATTTPTTTTTPSRPAQSTPARTAHAAPPPAALPPASPPPAAPAAPASVPASTGAHRSCDSPFTVGSDGIRQIKPECM